MTTERCVEWQPGVADPDDAISEVVARKFEALGTVHTWLDDGGRLHLDPECSHVTGGLSDLHAALVGPGDILGQLERRGCDHADGLCVELWADVTGLRRVGSQIAQLVGDINFFAAVGEDEEPWRIASRIRHVVGVLDSKPPEDARLDALVAAARARAAASLAAVIANPDVLRLAVAEAKGYFPVELRAGCGTELEAGVGILIGAGPHRWHTPLCSALWATRQTGEVVRVPFIVAAAFIGGGSGHTPRDGSGDLALVLLAGGWDGTFRDLFDAATNVEAHT